LLNREEWLKRLDWLRKYVLQKRLDSRRQLALLKRHVLKRHGLWRLLD